MKTFHCDHCGNLVFFENVTCLACGHALGFIPDVLDLSALEPAGDGTVKALVSDANASGRRYRPCANGERHAVCNWLVPAEDAEPFCASCRLNVVIPDLNVFGNRERWHKLEMAKRRLIYTLLWLGIQLNESATPGKSSLRFQFLGETPGGLAVRTGHEGGLITVNVTEADDDVREQRRVSLHEPFRSLLGHFRHEIGHYYWDQFIAPATRLFDFRRLFGDERMNYPQALQNHYRYGPPTDWVNQAVSAYATAHPWEDWAETWAHYLHVVDTVETAASFGLSLKPTHPSAQSMQANLAELADQPADFDTLISVWFPLTYALNSLNRGMGLSDLYPFVLSPLAIKKLRFVHETIALAAKESAEAAADGLTRRKLRYHDHPLS